jgi:hypothetical protein
VRPEHLTCKPPSFAYDCLCLQWQILRWLHEDYTPGATVERLSCPPGGAWEPDVIEEVARRLAEDGWEVTYHEDAMKIANPAVGGLLRVRALPGCGYPGCNAPTIHTPEGCPSRPVVISGWVEPQGIREGERALPDYQEASPTPEQQEIARLRGALREIQRHAIHEQREGGWSDGLAYIERAAAAALGEEEG